MSNDPESWERQKYQEDAFAWFKWNFDSVESELTKTIRLHSELQRKQIKSFVQNASEHLDRNLLQIRDTMSSVQNPQTPERNLMLAQNALIFWIGAMAIIALASAGLWIGVGGVTLVLTFAYLRRRQQSKMDSPPHRDHEERDMHYYYRLDRFRNRFRELLNKKDYDTDMLKEDREFLETHADTILFPLAVRYEDRQERETNDIDERDLEHIETLYREYFDRHRHPFRFSFGETDQKHVASCELCAAALRTRQHFENVLSKVQTESESEGNKLSTKSDVQYKISLLRRFVSRDNAEAMFSDVVDAGGEGVLRTLSESFKSYGFDGEMVSREMHNFSPEIRKHLGKERDECEKLHERELAAMLTFIKAEQRLREKRDEEWSKAALSRLS